MSNAGQDAVQIDLSTARLWIRASRRRGKLERNGVEVIYSV